MFNIFYNRSSDTTHHVQLHPLTFLVHWLGMNILRLSKSYELHPGTPRFSTALSTLQYIRRPLKQSHVSQFLNMTRHCPRKKKQIKEEIRFNCVWGFSYWGMGYSVLHLLQHYAFSQLLRFTACSPCNVIHHISSFHKGKNRSMEEKVGKPSESYGIMQHANLKWHIPYLLQRSGPSPVRIILIRMFHNLLSRPSHYIPFQVRLVLIVIKQYMIKLDYFSDPWFRLKKKWKNIIPYTSTNPLAYPRYKSSQCAGFAFSSPHKFLIPFSLLPAHHTAITKEKIPVSVNFRIIHYHAKRKHKTKDSIRTTTSYLGQASFQLASQAIHSRYNCYTATLNLQ